MDLLYSDLTYKLQGCFFTVFNTLGHGYKENIYQKALASELKSHKINFLQEPPLSIKYKEETIGIYRPDFFIEKKVIVELKSLEYLPTAAIKQLVHYLKGTSVQLGFLVNFGSDKLQIIRRVWTQGSA